MATPAVSHASEFRRELGLRDVILAQVMNVVGSSWVGVASKLGKAHPLFGAARLRKSLPTWLGIPALAGLISSAIAILIAVCPIIDVVSNLEYAGKIIGVLLVSNLADVFIYALQRYKGPTT